MSRTPILALKQLAAAALCMALIACTAGNQQIQPEVSKVNRAAVGPVETVVAAPINCAFGKPDFAASNPTLASIRERALATKAITDEARRRTIQLGLGVSVVDAALRHDAIQQAARAGVFWSALDSEFAPLKWRISESAKAGNAYSQWLLLEAKNKGAAWSVQDCTALVAIKEQLLAATGLTMHAQYRTAQCLTNKAGAEAISLMRASAELGHPSAQEAVGRICANEVNGRVCAIEYLCKAADGGRASAAGLAAFLLTEQTPNPANAVRAAALYEMAVNAGDQASANNLGELYEQGWIGKRDIAQAMHWYRKGAEAGLPEAALNLARLLLGNNASGNRQEAIRWLQQIAAQKPAEVLQLKTQYGIAEQN